MIKFVVCIFLILHIGLQLFYSNELSESFDHGLVLNVFTSLWQSYFLVETDEVEVFLGLVVALFVQEFACEINAVDELTCLAEIFAKIFFVVSKWLYGIDLLVFSDSYDIPDPIILMLKSFH